MSKKPKKIGKTIDELEEKYFGKKVSKAEKSFNKSTFLNSKDREINWAKEEAASVKYLSNSENKLFMDLNMELAKSIVKLQKEAFKQGAKYQRSL